MLDKTTKQKSRNYPVLLIIALSSLLSACAQVTFIQGEIGEKAPEQDRSASEWHHHGPFGFIEFSPPVDLDERCQGEEWQQVSTYISTGNWLVSNAVSLMTGVSLYGARTVSYACEHKLIQERHN
jgi:hypothetical protein